MRAIFRLSRAKIAYAHDIFIAAISLPLSLWLRMGASVETVPESFVLQSTVLFAVICAALFWPMGLYRGIWRYASMNDLMQLARAVTVLIVAFALEMFLIFRLEGVPRSVPFINWFVLLAMLGGPRFLYRMLKDRHFD